jgi:hypothetical protein
MTRRWSVLLVLCLAACDGASPGVDGGPGFDAAVTPPDASPGGCTGDERRVRLVYYGTATPTEVPLSDGQVLAIGDWDGCSGAFVTDEWVLTAKHCGIRLGRAFCVGPDPRNPNVCFRAAEVQDHPSVDMALVRMDAPASSRLPELEPIPIMTERIDESWFGTLAEAAGYGTQEDGSSGEREFTAEPIVAFEGSEFVVIDGMGERGVCFGDSGGPLMVLASDATVRVLGDLSYGDPSCVGRDRYTRTDLVVDWIESHTGPTVATGGSCGRLTAEGDCMGARAVWCEDEVLVSERCEGGTACGWDAEAEGYRCLAGPDPCEGVSAAGECRGSVATWCDRGQLRSRDCAPCGEVCGDVPEVGGVYCHPDPCEGLDYHGECRGDVAVWCEEGEVQMRDCAAEGLRCGYVNDRIGYFCGR